MSGKTLKILFVEDDPGDVALVRKLLDEIKGYELFVEYADSLAEGIGKIQEQEFDVMLLDISLPDGRGIHAVSRVHADAPQIPIVVMNVVDNELLSLDTVKEGAQDYLVKDQVTPHQLKRSMLFAIQRKKVELELARLASFAWQNANAIFEMTLEGKVTYVNPAAEKHFPDLEAKTRVHPFLEQLSKVTAELEDSEKEVLLREVTVGDQVYEQHLSFIPQTRLIRSYILDVTERKQSEKALLMRTEEVERMNKVMLGRELKMIELKKKIKELSGLQDRSKTA